MGNGRLLLGTEALRGEGDWAQLCLYTGGRALEVDLSPAQLTAVALALCLVRDEEGVEALVGDELLASEVIPSLLEAMPGLWERGGVR